MKKLFTAIALLTACAAFGNSQIITYALLPGSTITPTVGSAPAGPAESLTGTFQLVAVSQRDSAWAAFCFTGIDETPEAPEPLALAVPLSRFTPRVGGGSAHLRPRHGQ